MEPAKISAGFVIFVITLQRQESLTAELHKEHREGPHKPGTALLDRCKLGYTFFSPVQQTELSRSPLPMRLLQTSPGWKTRSQQS